MTHATSHDGEVPIESELPPQLLDDLRFAYQPPPHLTTSDAVVLRTTHHRVVPTRHQTRRRLLRPRFRLRLTLPVTALAVLLLGLGAYLHELTPAPVSAQTILRQVQTAGLAPNQVTAFRYQVTSTTGSSGTSTFWIKADSGGQVAGVLSSDNGSGWLARMLVAAYEMGSGHSSLAASQMAGQRTVDGHVVDVLTLPGRTLYVDAQRYVVRGADWSVTKGAAPSTWQARLLQYGTVPLSSVPAGIWHLHGTGARAGAGAKPTKP